MHSTSAEPLATVPILSGQPLSTCSSRGGTASETLQLCTRMRVHGPKTLCMHAGSGWVIEERVDNGCRTHNAAAIMDGDALPLPLTPAPQHGHRNRPTVSAQRTC